MYRITAPRLTLTNLLTCALLVGGPLVAQEKKPVATVAGVTLTEADLETFLSDQLAQLELQKAKLFEDAIGPLVEKTLLERGAKDAGVSLDEYLANAVAKHGKPVTDEQVDAWYETNKARLRGQAKEQLAPQIKDYLMQSQTAEVQKTLVADLREQHPVEIFLEPTRVPLGEEGATTKGPDDAPITIVEFSDFECPACRGFNPILDQVLEQYGDDVRVVFRQFPLRSIHAKAQKAAEAALCARDQGKFWELHDAMFANQRNIDIAGLKRMANEAGLESATFDQCLDSGQHAAVVQADLDMGARIGLTGTPSVYINGRVIAPGRVPSLGQMTSVIDEELLRQAKQ